MALLNFRREAAAAPHVAGLRAPLDRALPAADLDVAVLAKDVPDPRRRHRRAPNHHGLNELDDERVAVHANRVARTNRVIGRHGRR